MQSRSVDPDYARVRRFDDCESAVQRFGTGRLNHLVVVRAAQWAFSDGDHIMPGFTQRPYD